MKKFFSLLLISLLAFALVACAADNAPAPNSVTAVLEQQMNADSVPPETAEPVREQQIVSPVSEEPEAEVDVDLTKLSGTMLYSEVFNMLSHKDDYIGKTVRMRGDFAVYRALDENHEPIPDVYYFACVIADATACCQQGIEFVLEGEHHFPEDYPKQGAEITVTGEFRTYLEYGDRFAHLVHAELTA